MLRNVKLYATSLLLGGVLGCSELQSDGDQAVTAAAALLLDGDAAATAPACVFGSDYVRIGSRSNVNSDLGSNGWVEVQAGTSPERTSIGGDIRSRDWIRVGSTTSTGDLTSGSWVHVQTGSEVGTVTQYASVPFTTLATQSVRVGTVDVVLQNPPNCARQITPGQYRNITVNSGCRLKLLGGSYDLESVYIQSNAVLEVTGTVAINANSVFSFSDHATLVGVAAPEQLTIYSNQAVRIGSDVSFAGMILAPNGDATIAPRTSYSGCIRARRTLLDTDVDLTSFVTAECNPPLDSVSAAHGNTDWHIDTANAFLFGVAMNGTPWAANHAPSSWTRRHIHVGANDTASFYHDNTVDAAGRDTEATSGIDRDMLFFYAGHGNPDDFNAIEGTASPAKMRLGNCGNGSRLRYYWQCSSEVFAHGPHSCPGGGWPYSCPEHFDGSRDSFAMRNVYQRWGGAIDSGSLRMACGASTHAFCWGPQANQIWDNYLNLGLDVADSFVYGLRDGTTGPVVPLCMTTGGSDVTTTPLFDKAFTNKPNLGGDYYHIQFLSQFGTSASNFASRGYSHAALPVLNVSRPNGLATAFGRQGFTEGDFYVSKQLVGDREAQSLVHRDTGAKYFRGTAGVPTLRGDALPSGHYIKEAENFVAVLGWTESSIGVPHGSRTLIARQLRTGGETTVFQKNVTVTFPRLVEVQGAYIPVLGAGGRMIVQLNSDGSVQSASKVWRDTTVGPVVPLKPFDSAVSEAWATLSSAESYRLESWSWGYKEEAGNVAQEELRVIVRFRFVAKSNDTDRPPQIVEVKVQ